MNLSKPNLSKLAQGILIFLFISVINVLMVIKFPMKEIITYVHLPPTLHLLEGGGGGGGPAGGGDYTQDRKSKRRKPEII